ncbi:MAG TPA: hypothetical protein ENI11_00290 [Actinobacteria bacterium]|nr:hypothetical protein [Actinomycetota bacterium]
MSEPSPVDFSGYLDGLENLGIEPSLLGIEALCHELANPQSRFDTIQVTGTNGKTSTSRMIQALLSASGLTVGVYTSPHLEDYRERIMVDGVQISEADFSDIGGLVQEKARVAEQSLAGRRITQFEVITAAAFEYFARRAVKVAVLEGGMGARWDATSLVAPEVGVVTNVSLDHAGWLGPKLEDIAGEKAYVIQEGNSVIIGPVSRVVMRIFDERATAVGAYLLKNGEHFSKSVRDSGELELVTPKGAYFGISLGASGPWQAENALLAAVSAETYLDNPLEPKTVRNVLDTVKVPGRAELVPGSPEYLLDGAHNRAGIERLVSFLRSQYQGRRLIFLVSILRDKEAPGMVADLCHLGNKIIFTSSKNPRCYEPDELKELASHSSAREVLSLEMGSAIKEAAAVAGDEGLVVVTGSLFLVGAVRKLLRNQGSIFA